MEIIINNITYPVRNNYLHRGTNPRLVLNIKEAGGFVWIQFENNQRVVNDLAGNKKYWADSYKGYWCNKDGYTDIDVIIKDL